VGSAFAVHFQVPLMLSNTAERSNVSKQTKSISHYFMPHSEELEKIHVSCELYQKTNTILFE